MGNEFSTLLTLGVVGVGGYLFVTQVWPMMKRELEDSMGGDEERFIPPAIIEDRIPDYIVEDRYPDYNIIEDRYPDYYPYPQPYPYPVPYPTIPSCPPGRYWNGDRCKKIDIDCPPGYREDDGVCKPRNCDRDEIFDGWKCVKIPRPPRRPDRDRDWDRDRDRPRIPIPVPRPDRDRDRKPPERRFGSNRDKWNADREAEEKMKGKEPGTPETDRLQEITEKAVQSFIEIWEV